MTIEIPDEVLKSDLSLTAKVIVAAVMCYPTAPKKQLCETLGVNRNTLFKCLKKAKDEGVYISTDCSQIGTHSTNLSTPYLVRKLEVEEKETKTLKATTPPTKEEVAKYADSQSAAELVEEFYSTYSERGWMANGEPIKSWKAMFRGWVRNKKAAPTQTKTKPSISAEEARYLMDAAS